LAIEFSVDLIVGPQVPAECLQRKVVVSMFNGRLPIADRLFTKKRDIAA